MKCCPRILVVHLGVARYDAVYGLQRLVFDVKAGGRKRHRMSPSLEPYVDPVPDVVFTVEHAESVYTMGRRDTSAGIRDPLLSKSIIPPPKHGSNLTAREWLVALKAPTDSDVPLMRRVERGGGLTWHGRGQATMYPIVGVREAFGRQPTSTRGKSILHWWVSTLEECMIHVVAETSALLPPHHDTLPVATRRNTGVWVDDCKIGFVGVSQSDFVSMHGCSLNVCCELSAFDRIVMCEMPDKAPTSLQEVFLPFVGTAQADPSGWIPCDSANQPFAVPDVATVTAELASFLTTRLRGEDSCIVETFSDPAKGLAAVLDAVKCE